MLCNAQRHTFYFPNDSQDQLLQSTSTTWYRACRPHVTEHVDHVIQSMSTTWYRACHMIQSMSTEQVEHVIQSMSTTWYRACRRRDTEHVDNVIQSISITLYRACRPRDTELVDNTWKTIKVVVLNAEKIGFLFTYLCSLYVFQLYKSVRWWTIHMSTTRSMPKKRKTSLPDYNVWSQKKSRPRTKTKMAAQNGSVTTKTQPAILSKALRQIHGF